VNVHLARVSEHGHAYLRRFVDHIGKRVYSFAAIVSKKRCTGVFAAKWPVDTRARER
jgi:hypothetical protein